MSVNIVFDNIIKRSFGRERRDERLFLKTNVDNNIQDRPRERVTNERGKKPPRTIVLFNRNAHLILGVAVIGHFDWRSNGLRSALQIKNEIGREIDVRFGCKSVPARGE
jgi:hypothetical protein